MPHPELDELLELFGQEQACYTALLDLSRKQKETIVAGHVDPLLAILGEKQQVLARVANIEARLLPYKNRWHQMRETLEENSRQVLDLALSTVADLLGELISLEREGEQLLRSRRVEISEQIEEADKMRNLHQAYSHPWKASESSRFLDLEGI